MQNWKGIISRALSKKLTFMSNNVCNYQLGFLGKNVYMDVAVEMLILWKKYDVLV